MRIGLAGAGRIGRMHAQILRDLDVVDQLLVADVDPEASREVAESHGFEPVDSVERLFDSDLDGLVIAAATDAHAALVTAAVEADVSVFVEKPLAVDLDGSVDLVKSLSGSEVAVQVGFQRRFDPGYVAAKQRVDSGDLGWLHTLRSCTLDPAPPTPAYVAASGGLFRDCGVHDFDSIRWISGREVVEVTAYGANRGDRFFADHDDVDTGSALLLLDDGTMATVTCTRYNAAGYDVRLEVLGERGSVSVGLDDQTPLRSTEPDVRFPSGTPYSAFPERFAAAYRAELAAFVTQVVRDGAPSPCTPEDALEAFMIAEAAELSRRERRPVALEEVRR